MEIPMNPYRDRNGLEIDVNTDTDHGIIPPFMLFIVFFFSSITIFTIGRIVYRKIRFGQRYKLPPRVPGIPIFGNTFQIPIGNQGEWARAQARRYGEMFTCQLGSNTWIFLNSSRVVNDILEKRAAIYSSRPDFPMVQGIMSGNARIVLMKYGDRWRELRRIMHSILNSRRGDVYRPYQERESARLLGDYLHRPDRWFAANQRFSNAVIMSVIFGRRLRLDDPNLVELLEQSEDFIAALQPGANLVDAFPVLDRLPKFLQWWRPRGERAFEKSKRVYGREVDLIQEKMQQGKAPECFAVDFLKATENNDHFDRTQKLFVLGSLIEAGSDTSRGTLTQIIAAAAIYPDWVETAQRHLDRVCGHPNAGGRLPVFADRDELTYITAATKEGFRWRPFAQIGVPHCLTRDDEYEGYRFPAGTVFTWNSYGIALDENEYEQPDRFWPERFLDENVGNALKGHWSFGPGRRVCSGYAVGEANVWIAVARLLYCFNFEQVPDRPIDSYNTQWFMIEPAPFAVRFQVRSEAHARLIEESAAAAEAAAG